ncbi:MAG: phosphotransferase, partial [Proteobacteria bacterium]|nr:phosphotransferase [Pseudomonadota bacterium]
VFRNPRSQGTFHDTAAKVEAMRQALDTHRGDAFWDETAVLAGRVELLWASIATDIELPERVVHGDLKISNLRFQGGEAIALIDLDTLARGTLDAELGDALRSWCNTAGEDAPPTFDLDVLGAAMRGYASEAEGVTDAEWESVVSGTMRIAVELAARFAADALERNYFGFDPALGSGRHNVIRAQGQLDLAEQIAAVRARAEQVVAAARG